MSNTIPPSEEVRQQLRAFLREGLQTSEQPTSDLLRLAAQVVVQEMLEQEVTDFLGRERYERRSGNERGYRNGYEPGRIRSAEGQIEVRVPQVRDSEHPYRSTLMDFLRGNSDVLEELVVQMYTRGLSTRDIEEALRDPVTGETLLSKSAVSDLTDRLWEEYMAFCQRDLSVFQVEYLFMDGLYEGMRLHKSRKEAILVAWGVCRDGRKVLLHLALGNKESESACTAFVRDMVRRGLPVPTLVTTDGAPALMAAVEAAWSRSLRQRCLVHKVRNVLDKVPEGVKQEMKQALWSIYDAPNREVADLLAARFITRYAETYPAAVACFQDDLAACLNHLECPVGHRKRIRTTNLLERAFLEVRRRTRATPRFFDERGCLKLIFATLMQVSDRWQRIRFSELDRAHLDHLRQRLGIEEVLSPISLVPA
jgi:transposase-like protein